MNLLNILLMAPPQGGKDGGMANLIMIEIGRAHV